MDYETVKKWGKNRFEHHKQTQATGLRSLDWFGSNNKHRGMRQKADRHSHHRRRNHIRNKISSGNLQGIEDVPPPSSSKQRKYESGWSHKISNRKSM
jgi:hypothetical protein